MHDETKLYDDDAATAKRRRTLEPDFEQMALDLVSAAYKKNRSLVEKCTDCCSHVPSEWLDECYAAATQPLQIVEKGKQAGETPVFCVVVKQSLKQTEQHTVVLETYEEEHTLVFIKLPWAPTYKLAKWTICIF